MMYIIRFNALLLVSALFLTGAAQAAYDNYVVLKKVLNSRSTHADTPDNLYKIGNKEGPLAGWFLSNNEIKDLTDKLVQEFMHGDAVLDPLDIAIIGVLKNDLSGYYISEPILEYLRPYSTRLTTHDKTPIYKISGWRTFPFSTTNEADLRSFLKLFLAGAHFVIVGNNPLLADISKLSHAAKNHKHSHYRQTPQAYVFPDLVIAGGGGMYAYDPPKPAPIITALLIDKVVLSDDSDVGTFFQLEGWPYHAGSHTLTDGVLHGADFLTHRNTVWNISTYGLSPYSEKRGTTVFLTHGQPDQTELLKLAKKTFASDYTNYAEDKRK